jgi:alanyl-tRNA synthetase
MNDPTASAVRQLFLDYFARADHAVVKSSSLIPANDPTLMFTNAGMVQFKDVFVGAEKRPYTRAASSQKCMRVSGKHNDLEEVGRTARHHTFFEMLGNFSFGDYFKEEAIELAWRFITREVGFDPNRLWITVFGGEAGLPPDDEARALWRKISGLPEHRILGLGMKDNFWAMGDTGPCGPCSEIHFDQGGDGEPTLDDFETGRVVEIWNNVFMQFERKVKGGELIPLPAPSVDTGMGLERLTAVLQGETSNYHTDLFAPIIDSVAQTAGKPYQRGDSEDDVSMRVIADHARATALLVADGVQPSNGGRGYVMRRIMRRAIRHGKRLGFDELFFAAACDAVVTTLGDAYPELHESRTLIQKVAENEEKSFRRTLDTGLRMLSGHLQQLAAESADTLPGLDAFTLYDTYGFPLDLTEVIAREAGITVDVAGFHRFLEEQKKRGKGSKLGDAAVSEVYREVAARVGEVEFIGYPHEDTAVGERPGTWRERNAGGSHFLEAEVVVKALVRDGRVVESAGPGEVEVVLDPTPFYGEAGGQVGDAGVIVGDNGLSVEVLDCKKPVESLTVCQCRLLEGEIRTGASVWAGYEPAIRKETRAHHSATHLLHGALRAVLGDHVKQQGSLVDPDHLRFDYAHFEAPTWEQLQAVEDRVNAEVAAASDVTTEVLPFDIAKQKGAIALFGEKYGDEVRVVTMGRSIELCGGTHANNTGAIDLLLVTNEEAVASGVRRIEAEVSRAARSRTSQTAALLARAEAMLAEPDKPQANTDQPVLMAVVKAIRNGNQLRAELRAAGLEPTPLPEGAVSTPHLEDDFSVAQARAVRDSWHGLVTLVNVKGTEVDAVAERFAGADRGGLLKRFAELVANNRDNEKKLAQARSGLLSEQAGDLIAAAQEVNGVQVVATRVDGIDGKGLRELADKVRDKLTSGILCLGGRQKDKATLLIAVTQDLTTRFRAGDLVKELAPIVGGRGGGKPELAQAGGNDPDALESVFARLSEIVARG